MVRLSKYRIVRLYFNSRVAICFRRLGCHRSLFLQNGRGQGFVECHAGRPAEQLLSLVGVSQLAGAIYLASAAWIGLDADIPRQQAGYAAHQFFDGAFNARAEVEAIVSSRLAVVAQNGYQPGGDVIGMEVVALGSQITQAQRNGAGAVSQLRGDVRDQMSVRVIVGDGVENACDAADAAGTLRPETQLEFIAGFSEGVIIAGPKRGAIFAEC